jgi:hypothetical protein
MKLIGKKENLRNQHLWKSTDFVFKQKHTLNVVSQALLHSSFFYNMEFTAE